MHLALSENYLFQRFSTFSHMTLREELALCQFAQGTRSSTEVLSLFNGLEEAERGSRFFDLYLAVAHSDFIQEAIAQALAHNFIQENDELFEYLHLQRLRTQSKNSALLIPYSGRFSEDRLGEAIEVLLHLFKIDYQQCLAVQQRSNASSWWDWDLSDPQVTEAILSTHQERVDQVYADSGYHCEFTSLAKLSNENKLELTHQESNLTSAEGRPDTGYLSYEALMTESIKRMDFRNSVAFMLLRESMLKALSTRYRISLKEAEWVFRDVLKRYLHSTEDADLT